MVAPDSWRTLYYELMRELGRDTVRTGMLKLKAAAPRFEEIRFQVADSLPGHVAYGYTDAVELIGMATPATRELLLKADLTDGDSIPAWVLRHEMAHMITGRVDHPVEVFSASLHTVWEASAARVASIASQVATR